MTRPPSAEAPAAGDDARGPFGADAARLLSVVAPCYNESPVILRFHRELAAVLDGLAGLTTEIIFVDDGSTDDTLTLLNELSRTHPTVRVCSLSRNFGHQIALAAGLDRAAGDAVVLMDSDLQHPPELIREFVDKWRDGHDIVLSIRRATEGASMLKRVTSRGFYTVLNYLSGTQVPPGAADFCLLSRQVCESLRSMPERHRFLRGLIAWAGFDRALVPYDAAARAAGESKYTFLKMIGLAVDAVFSFSSAPLRLALRSGLVMTLLGFAYLIVTLGNGFLFGGIVPGYASLIGVVTILGGCQLAFLGLIGQYLARVFEEVKRRPMYLVKQEAPPRLVPTRVEREDRLPVPMPLE